MASIRFVGGAEPVARLASELRGRQTFHCNPEHHTFLELRAMGVAVEPVSDEVPPDAVLLLVRERPALNELVDLIDRLLGPEGCPWDREQTHATLKRHLVEEAHEVLDAIDSGDADAIREELGDLLLQPVLHAQIAAKDGEGYDTEGIARTLVDKLVRRHPHVFGDAVASDPETVLRNWEAIKRAEMGDRRPSTLDGVPNSLPALARAQEVSRKAARQGFEWPDLAGVLAKLEEERRELLDAVAAGDARSTEAELGDLLFTIVNLARWLDVDAETALRRMVDRFGARYRRMEALADRPLKELSPEAWDDLWNQAKSGEVPSTA